MASLVLEETGVSAEVDLHIEKRLPIQGGLGAGSANAVAALIGLEEELKTELGTKGLGAEGLHSAPFERKRFEGWGIQRTLRAKRLEIAAQVGSDVPLFLVGGTVLGIDRGQDVYPLPDIEPVWCVVALPAVGVSTPQAFRDWDDLCLHDGLTADASAAKLNELSRAYASAFSGGIPGSKDGAGSSGVLSMREDLAGPQESALVRTGITSWIQNDFERVVFPQHPSLAEIKRILAASDTPEAAIHASLSGSGSALFGLYRTREDAEASQERLAEAKHFDVRSILTRTKPRAEYWGQMLL
jgi:4-diphosphocytidyl-2-C-methyl-D-erythritol kinase